MAKTMRSVLTEPAKDALGVVRGWRSAHSNDGLGNAIEAIEEEGQRQLQSRLREQEGCARGPRASRSSPAAGSEQSGADDAIGVQSPSTGCSWSHARDVGF